MLILALDTTTAGGSVAVVQDDEVRALVHGDGSRTHGERLPGELDTALGQAGVTAASLDLLAVASGPGAFTGLRIGLAAIQGLAMVIAKPVVGVSALEALADTVWYDAPAISHVATWMDAQRGEVFAAWHVRAQPGGETRASDPIVASATVALASMPFERGDAITFVGDGALRYRSVIDDAWSSRAAIVAPTPALAPAIARLARVRASQGLAGPPHALQPLYVRRPDAELDRARQGGA